MMPSDFIATGSVSQDALRLGFQPTCNKGIATLLKVDDITIEECNRFMERHLDRVNAYLESAVEGKTTQLEAKFRDEYFHLTPSRFHFHVNKSWVPSPILYLFVHKKYKKQKAREHVVSIIKVDDPFIDLNSGSIITKVSFNIIKKAWEGYTTYDYRVEEETTEIELYPFKTEAKKCSVKYIPYDHYHDRYIPDEAAIAAKQAKDIGMTGLQVAIPIVADSVKSDPIIVGFIDKQMFIIAWFGYDKNNHMACNI